MPTELAIRPGLMHRVLPEGSHGRARIVHDSPDLMQRLRAERDGQPLRCEKYTRLTIGGWCWMTDAEFEVMTYRPILRQARGDLLMVGLGIGLFLRHLPKAVRSVTVLEIHPDVIALVGPRYPKAKIICDDAFTWAVPPKAFDCIFLDIWPHVPDEETAEQIKRLKTRFRPALRRPGWVKAWCEELTRKDRQHGKVPRLR